MRKMLVAMAKDARVLIIKLADRLHNMRTIAAMPDWKQKRTAQETIDIYAPLAHRLGMQEMKWQLEDLSFAVLHPKVYAEIEQMVATRAPERDIYLGPGARAGARAAGRAEDRRRRHRSAEALLLHLREDGREGQGVRRDLRPRRHPGARRLGSQDCYAALGSIHAMWKPVQGRFKDYIAMPKFNLYQSLHTTVVGPQGKPLEIQIRTRQMHHTAEKGIAAHWGYKENASAGDIAWLQRIVDWQQETADPDEFLETLKLDLEQDEVFVFTPKGDVITLPVGATPIDFAYAIHTEVGHRCIGARSTAGWRRSTRSCRRATRSRSFTSKVPTAGPSRDWLEDRRHAAGPQQDPPVVLAGAARGRHRERPGRAVQGAAQGGPAGPEAGVVAGAAEDGRVDELRRPRRAARRHRREPRVGQVDRAAPGPRAAGRRPRGAAADDGSPAPAAVAAARRSASTSRGSTT